MCVVVISFIQVHYLESEALEEYLGDNILYIYRVDYACVYFMCIHWNMFMFINPSIYVMLTLE